MPVAWTPATQLLKRTKKIRVEQCAPSGCLGKHFEGKDNHGSTSFSLRKYGSSSGGRSIRPVACCPVQAQGPAAGFAVPVPKYGQMPDSDSAQGSGGFLPGDRDRKKLVKSVHLISLYSLPASILGLVSFSLFSLWIHVSIQSSDVHLVGRCCGESTIMLRRRKIILKKLV